MRRLDASCPWLLGGAVALQFACARPLSRPPFDQVRAEGLRAHMAFLADDLLEGRATGTRGYQLAANYVAAQFRQLGLEPAGTEGTFFQQVAYRQVEFDRGASRVVLKTGANRELQLRADEDYAAYGDNLREDVAVEAGVVFVGFGVTAPEIQYDDYAGVDVSGKVVLLLPGAPPKLPSAPRAHYSAWPVKRQTAVDHGAIGVMAVWAGPIAAELPFAQVARFSHQLDMSWLDAGGRPNESYPSLRVGRLVLNPVVAAPLFEGADRSLDAAVRMAEQSTPQAFALPVSVAARLVSKHTARSSPNVAAVLTGSDPALSKEYIVVTAHADHVGIGDPVDGDAIYNGALDNASGIAAMLEIARALKANVAPRRSVLFVAVGGEEEGLLGSDYFAQHPTVAATAIAANVNIDGVSLLYDFRDVVAFGGEHSTLGAVVDEVARGMELEVSPDPMPEQMFFVRSDQYSFVRRGVPAVTLSEGFKTVDRALDGRKITLDWMGRNYHTPQDDMRQPLNFEAAVKCTRLYLGVIHAIAQQPARPAWKAGDFFARFANTRAAAAPAR